MDREKRSKTTPKPEVSKTETLEHPLRMLKTISARLARTGGLDARLNDTLAELGALICAVHAYVFQFRQSGAFMEKIHGWSTEGPSPAILQAQRLRSEPTSWFLKRLRQGECFRISHGGALPAETDLDRLAAEMQGSRSRLIFPTGRPGHPLGFVGFDHGHEASEWQPDDIDLLEIASQLMGDALERQRSYQTLELSVQRQKAILENIPDIAWLKAEDSRFIRVNEAFSASCGVSADELIGKTDLDIWPQVLAAVPA